LCGNAATPLEPGESLGHVSLFGTVSNWPNACESDIRGDAQIPSGVAPRGIRLGGLTRARYLLYMINDMEIIVERKRLSRRRYVQEVPPIKFLKNDYGLLGEW
jgi:hypothetical protein